MTEKDITGIIIAGGKSSRIGVNKSLLKIDDKTIIEFIVETLLHSFEKVIIISNDIDSYKFIKLKTYPDIYINKGPLGGIHSGLFHSDTEKNFVVSCDMPLVTKEIISYITNYPSEKKIKVASLKGKIQPLCGFYSKSVLKEVEEILNDSISENYSVRRLIEITGSEVIELSDNKIFSENAFLNINNIEDFQFFKKNFFV